MRSRVGVVLVSSLVALATPAAAQDAGGDVIAIHSGTLAFAPSRDDVTVGTVWFNVYCSRPSEVRIDGEAPEDEWHHLVLPQVSKNRFALPDVRIEVPEGYAGIVCLSLKVWFTELGNQHDAMYYANLPDRYALVSFCTRPEGPDWERARPRFSQNRVATLDALRETLTRPFRIALNDRPLPHPRR